MNAFIDIIATQPVKDAESFAQSDEEVLASGSTRKNGTATSDGRTWRRFRPRPRCSGFGLFAGWPSLRPCSSGAAASGITSLAWTMSVTGICILKCWLTRASRLRGDIKKRTIRCPLALCVDYTDTHDMCCRAFVASISLIAAKIR